MDNALVDDWITTDLQYHHNQFKNYPMSHINERGCFMYRTILLILYIAVLIPAMLHLIRYREIPLIRRLSAGLGIAGILLCPLLAGVLCEILTSLFSIGIFLIIIIGGFGLMLKSLFR